MKKATPASKLCVRCNKILPLLDFYANKSWSAQKYHDAWCKECAAQYCRDMETTKQYCYENNRMWKDATWDTAVKKALYVLSTNADYLKPTTSDKRKKEILNTTTVKQFFGMMNLGFNYQELHPLSV